MSGDASDEAAAAAGEKAIYRVFIAAPIETVWSTLVRTDEVLPFLFGAVCRARDGLSPGKVMRMVTPDGQFASVVGKVLEFEPPRLFAHTMTFTTMEDAPVTVIYELKEAPGGTDFSLTTLGAVPGSKTSKSMAQGGPYIVNTLKAVVETGKPSFGTRMMLVLFGLMTPFTPARARAENWPDDKILKL